MLLVYAARIHLHVPNYSLVRYDLPKTTAWQQVSTENYNGMELKTQVDYKYIYLIKVNVVLAGQNNESADDSS